MLNLFLNYGNTEHTCSLLQPSILFKKNYYYGLLCYHYQFELEIILPTDITVFMVVN